ncbi:MAG: hypothetical protein KF906_09120 [Actinobacteria bacterium]|nr:hypothetical protein [Actinomycetota bacterium]
MIVACWSVKGGVGTTVVAAGTALSLVERSARPVLLVDLAGDLPSCLGIAEPAGPGVAEWSGAGSDVPADALDRLTVAAAPGVDLLPRGGGSIDAARAELLVQLLASSGRVVVVDCGSLPAVTGGAPAVVASQAERSVLVVRPCLLGLRRAVEAPLRPSGVVVVREPGRALTAADVASVVGAPVLAELAVDPAVARAVDAGLFAARLPRGFATAVRRVAA